jgi:hypothetical protein
MYKSGDRVVYLAIKHSAHPGRRAEQVQPEPHGEGYSYGVKKYWLVARVEPSGMITVITRRGKERTLPASDPRLRAARWWETLFFGSRFPQPGELPNQPASPRSPDESRVSARA